MAKHILILLAAPITLFATSVAASAQGADESRSVIVRYHDLNLASVEGRARLNTRVKSAVKTVCGSRHSYRRTLTERAKADHCEATALADADVKLAGLFNGNGARLADRGTIVVVAAP